MEMTSECDPANSAQKMQNYHHMTLNQNPLKKIFCVRQWLPQAMLVCSSELTLDGLDS